jgi:hypothetical protein
VLHKHIRQILYRKKTKRCSFRCDKSKWIPFKVLGRELIYFVKHETKCKEWYTGNEVISMLDNIFAEVGRHIFNKSSATSFCAIEMGGLWQYNLCNPACKELFQSCGMLCFPFYYAFWVLLLYVQLKRYGASMSQMTTDMFRLS